MDDFKFPDLSNHQLEVRIDGDEVALYGTIDGLKEFAALCCELSDATSRKGESEHVHVEDRIRITKRSARFVIACFEPGFRT